MYRGYTEAQARAKKRYMARFVHFKLRMEPDRREEVRAYALSHGHSLHGFITLAIDEKMERDARECAE